MSQAKPEPSEPKDDQSETWRSETWLGRVARWTRIGALVSLACCPLLLLWQIAGWMELHFWADVSIGSLIFPESDVARQFEQGPRRIVNDMLWIPLWMECLTLGLVLFVVHMLVSNQVEARRQARKRAHRATPGHSERRRRRSSR